MRLTETAKGNISQEISEATEIKITTDIRPGQASPAQKQVWCKLWRKLIAEVKNER